ncbi:LOW QUALITY PROTEIN: MB12A-like protein, partial [Mya arenaria]
GREVLVDVSIINERDPVPAGFTVVDTTEDTREKAIKKKVLCVRWMNASLTTSALSELIFLGKGTRRPPNGYTMVGDLNNLMLCYKMSQIKSISSIVHQNSSDSPLDNIGNMNNDLPYAINPRREDAYSQGSSAPARHNNTLDRQGSILTVTPLSGVPWQLNPRLQSLNNLNNVHIPEIRYKSIMDIENQQTHGQETCLNLLAFGKEPTLADKIHCVAFVLDGATLDELPQRIYPKQYYLHLIDDVVASSINSVLESNAVRENVREAAELMGIPEYNIHPIKNYNTEVELDLR